MDMQGQAEDKENLCHTLYNCHHRKFITGETVDDVLDHIVDLGAKSLVFVLSHSLKVRELKFCSVCTFFEGSALFFNF